VPYFIYILISEKDDIVLEDKSSEKWQLVDSVTETRVGLLIEPIV
jgi:hypothetical protein